MMNKFGRELKEFLEYENISVKEFASRIDITPKNLIDILKGEIELTQNMIYNISFVTNITVSYIENVEQNFKMDQLIDKYLNKENITIKQYINKFNYKEFSKLYNYNYHNERNYYSIAKDILRYLRISNPETLYKEDNSIFYKSKNDKPELLALWLERCNKIIKDEILAPYNKENINALVEYIKTCAKNGEFSKEALIKEFNKNGIYLAIEDGFKGSKIRGSFRVLNDKPAIYITRKHKRIADIYFALLHELAHCKSNFNRAKSGSLVSYLETEEKIDYEEKADLTAYNWMINEKTYNEIKNNIKLLNNIDEAKSFIVYRLAKDNIIKYSSNLYQKYNILIKY